MPVAALTLSGGVDHRGASVLEPNASVRLRHAGVVAAWVLSLAAAQPVLAQPSVNTLQGVWTTGPAAECPAKAYVWSGSGDDMQFRDPAGRLEVERIIERRPNGFITSTVTSATASAGTQWDYRFADVGSVQVRNLLTGRSFTLSRCPQSTFDAEAAAPAGQARPAQQRQATPSAPVATAAPVADRIGPSFDCARATDPLASLVCGDDQLARTDLGFTQTYQALRHQVGESGQQSLRQEAVEFQKQVYAACGLPRAGAIATAFVPTATMCVTQAYDNQRLAWSRRLAPAARVEATRPLEQHIQLQRTLQQLGYISSLARIDGLYGAATREAIKTWQTSIGIEPTGLLSATDAQRLMASSTPQQPADNRAAQQMAAQKEELERLRQQVEALKAQAVEAEKTRQAQEVAKAEEAARAERVAQVARDEQAARARLDQRLARRAEEDAEAWRILQAESKKRQQELLAEAFRGDPAEDAVQAVRSERALHAKQAQETAKAELALKAKQAARAEEVARTEQAAQAARAEQATRARQAQEAAEAEQARKTKKSVDNAFAEQTPTRTNVSAVVNPLVNNIYDCSEIPSDFNFQWGSDYRISLQGGKQVGFQRVKEYEVTPGKLVASMTRPEYKSFFEIDGNRIRPVGFEFAGIKINLGATSWKVPCDAVKIVPEQLVPTREINVLVAGLQTAIWSQDERAVSEFLKRGVDLNSKEGLGGLTPIQDASFSKHAGIREMVRAASGQPTMDMKAASLAKPGISWLQIFWLPPEIQGTYGVLGCGADALSRAMRFRIEYNREVKLDERGLPTRDKEPFTAMYASGNRYRVETGSFAAFYESIPGGIRQVAAIMQNGDVIVNPPNKGNSARCG